MNCRTAKDRTLARQDGPLSAGAESALQAHLSSCGGCALHARELELMHHLLRDLPVSEPSANFDWRLRLRLSKLQQEETEVVPSRGRFAWRWPLQFAGSAAVAAVGVLLIGAFFVYQERTPERVSEQPPHVYQNRSDGIVSGLQVSPVRDGAPIGPQPAMPARSFFINEKPVDSGSSRDSSVVPPSRDTNASK
jgi:anti-sigma factor RsiW